MPGRSDWSLQRREPDPELRRVRQRFPAAFLGAFATPFGPTPVLSGQTWNFQAWFRDFVGVSTSNFTHGVSVHFN
ncbi:MAG: hypothetical protein R3F17_10325 [Planctomycetota bacterium]